MGNQEAIRERGDAYKAAQSKVPRRIQLTGRQSWYRTIRKAHANMHEHPRHFWRWASTTAGWRQKGGASGIQPVLDINGRLLTALADIHQAWGEHFGRLVADSTGNSQDTEHWRHLDPHPQGPHWASLDESLTREDLWTALKKMRSYRALGGDGIPTELLRGCLKEETPPWLPEDTAPPTTHMTDSMLRLTNFTYEKGLVAGP
jgi:hypothetical protein